MSWQAPSSNGGSLITSYVVTASSGQTRDGRTGSRRILPPPRPRVTGLTNGVAVTFTVQAVERGPDGSHVVTLTLSDAHGPDAADAPTNVTAVPGNGQAAVSWQAPSSNGGSLITSYVVTASSGRRRR